MIHNCSWSTVTCLLLTCILAHTQARTSKGAISATSLTKALSDQQAQLEQTRKSLTDLSDSVKLVQLDSRDLHKQIETPRTEKRVTAIEFLVASVAVLLGLTNLFFKVPEWRA